MSVVVLSAPAKLTLSLRVVGLRDDGLHLVDAEMVAIDLADRLQVSDGDGLQVVPVGGGLEVVGGDDNLVARALRLAGRSAAVVVHKAIPAGAGLGGGSSDAAAILRWAGWTDVAEAAAIGADVSFCMVGGRARVTGVGEVVEPLEFRAMSFTLLTPSVGRAGWTRRRERKRPGAGGAGPGPGSGPLARRPWRRDGAVSAPGWQR